MKVVVPIPVNGRLSLVRQVVTRLYEKNKVYKVILIGHEIEMKKLAYELNADFLFHENYPLGAKWNYGFQYAMKYKPDAILFCGSSNFYSEDYIEIASSYLDKYEVVGKLKCHFVDKREDNFRLVFWNGYIGQRSGESIGMGRLLSERALKKIRWTPFINSFDSGMDGCMSKKLKKVRSSIKLLNDDQGILLSISTDKWKNKHNFERHWENILPSDKIDPFPFLNQFPEINLF